MHRSWLLAVLLVAATGTAQSGGHEHIAPLAPGAALPASPSPLANWPNGVWDLGEGFPSPDQGGVLTPSNPALLQRGDIRILKPWGPMPDHPEFVHCIAEIRPQTGLPSPAPALAEASFEIVVPASGLGEPEKRGHIVLLMSSRPTSTAATLAQRPFAPHDYPGDPAKHGIWPWGWPGPDFVTEFASNSAEFYVVFGHIVPRSSHRPLVSSVQRLRELWRAMVMLINEQYFELSEPEPTYTTCVAGGSFGGLTTMTALQLWPDEFHSGVSSAFNASLRATPGDQQMHDFFGGGLGLASSGAGYTLRDAVDWTIFCRLEGVDYMSLSPLIRSHVSGGLLRPMIIQVADEDLVTHGQDFMHPMLATSGHAQPYTGRRTFSDAQGSWTVDTVILGKNCHGPDLVTLAEPITFSNDPNIYGIDEPVRRMIYASHAQRTRVLQPLQQKKLSGPPSNMLTIDPNEQVHGRKAARTIQTPGPLLVEATAQQSWHSFGRGTWTGVGESLRVVKLPGEDRASVFVGSTDGIVTRYRTDPSAPVTTALVQQATSVSLGYGVWALDVGELMPSHAGFEVVAAAHRRVVVLDAATLAILHSAELTEWEQTQPRRLRIAEIYNGPNNNAEIVFCTLHGRIVVMTVDASGLVPVGEHSETGVQDILVGPVVGPRVQGTAFANGIWLLSARGHVAGLEFDSGLLPTTPKNIGKLSELSALQYGGLADLETTGSSVVLLVVEPPPGMKSIRTFGAPLSVPPAEFGRVDRPTAIIEEGDDPTEYMVPTPLVSTATDLAITAQGQYVTLFKGHLAVWNPGNDVALGLKNLDTIPAARGAAALAVGDVDGDGVDEVIVSTVSGRVIWFEVSELTTFTLNIAFTRSVSVVGNQVYEHRMNAAISSTWGLALGPGPQPLLHAIDPAGGWWAVDPLSGLPRLAVGRASLVLDTNIVGLRGFAYGGAGASSFTHNQQNGTNDTFWHVTAIGTSRVISTTPYVPKLTVAHK